MDYIGCDVANPDNNNARFLAFKTPSTEHMPCALCMANNDNDIDLEFYANTSVENGHGLKLNSNYIGNQWDDYSNKNQDYYDQNNVVNPPISIPTPPARSWSNIPALCHQNNSCSCIPSTSYSYSPVHSSTNQACSDRYSPTWCNPQYEPNKNSCCYCNICNDNLNQNNGNYSNV